MNVQSLSETPSGPAIEMSIQAPEGMVLIPAGTFLMGEEGWGNTEGPVHEVFVSDYWMDETPVTNRQFAAFVEATGYKTTAEEIGKAWGYNEGNYMEISGLSWKSYLTEERLDHPVVLVSWYDASAFARWSGKFLPTEAQWEKAARGGMERKQYPWGDQAPDGSQCNFAKSPSHLPPTTPVKHFPANNYRLFDMVGNVWQWCEDWFGDDYYATVIESNNTNPKGPKRGELKVRRGGSWNVVQPFRLRNSNRGALTADTAVPNMGFRCVWK